MQINIGVTIHNRFDLVLTDAKTGEVKQTAKAENLVCDTFIPYCAMGVMITSQYNRNQSGMRSIVLGTGTGTPSVTDTRMFNQIASYVGIPYYPGWTRTRLDAHTSSFTATVTADENTANGNLTEIGLGEAHSYDYETYGWETYTVGIYTHALFTDSEGNPITITKTNADRLTITATIYGTVTTNSAGNSLYVLTNYRNVNSSKISCDPRIDYVQGDGVYNTFTNSILGNINGSVNSSVNAYPFTLPTYGARSIIGLGSTTVTKNTSTNTVRGTTTARILADDGNFKYPTTTMIRSFTCNAIMICLPNASVYPSKQLTIDKIADGVTTDFNFGIPELNTNNVEVYINDVLQASNTYTFNGRDYTHIQGWKSYDTLYLDSFDYSSIYYSSGSYSNYHKLAFPVFIGPTDNYSRSVSATEKGIFIYDFKTNYTVSAIGKYLPTGVYTYGTPTKFVPKIYYSNDKETWTEITGLWDSVDTYINADNIGSSNPYKQITPVSARYWKVENPVIRIYSNESSAERYQLCCSIAFDDPKPQLHFNTAPPAESTVRIKAYCDYPIKNSNWIVEPGMTFDLTIARTS